MTTQAPPARRSGGRPLRILLVDDHPAVRYGVRQLLAGHVDEVAIVEAGEARRAGSATGGSRPSDRLDAAPRRRAGRDRDAARHYLGRAPRAPTGGRERNRT